MARRPETTEHGRPFLPCGILISFAVSTVMLLGSSMLSASESPNASSGIRTPLFFLENRGQFDDATRFRVAGGDRSLVFGESSVRIGMESALVTDDRSPSSRWWISIEPLGGRAVDPIGIDPLPGRVSVFKGSPDMWARAIPTYGGVRFDETWPGIDWVFRASRDAVKYELHVRPGADVDDVRLAWRGVDSLAITSAGDLVATTHLGSIRDERPIAWQEIDGNHRAVDVAYSAPSRLEDGGFVLGFDVGSYDRAYPLVIDPAIFVHAGYIGGAGADIGNAVARDADGNLYLVGDTNSLESSFPVTVGPDLTFNGGNRDGFIAKVSADGTALLYAGYIGGVEDDNASGVAFQPCREGMVNVGASGGQPFDVVIVNGTAGDAVRRVVVPVGGALDISMAGPPAGPLHAPFALYAWIGEPDVTTETPLPFSLGSMCLSSPLTGGAPQPVVIWNNAGRPGRLGHATRPSTAAPSVVLNLPTGHDGPVRFTLQGIIADDGSGAGVTASVTNAVLVEVAMP